MGRIGTDWVAGEDGQITVTHFAESDLEHLTSTHAGDAPCPVCVAEEALRDAEAEFNRALRDWTDQQRKERYGSRG